MVKLSAKAMGKRKAPAPQSNGSKKVGATKQELGPTGKPKRKADQPKKVKLRDQKSIPVPKSVFAGRERRGEEGSDDELDEDDDEDDEDEMMDLGEEEGLDASFLARMDESGLKRSIKEQKRLHDIVKAKEPIPKAERKKSGISIPEGSDSEDYDMDSLDDLDMDDDDDEEADLSGSDLDLGSGDDEDEDEEELGESDFASSGDEDDSDINDEYDEELDLSEADDGEVHEKRKRKRAEAEADYEQGGRTRWVKREDEDEGDEVEVGRLPIKLPTGEVQMVAGTTKLPAIKKKKVVEEDDVKQEESEEEEVDEGVQAARMASQKGKFGRMGVAEIVGQPGWKNAQKLEAAKEQIAGIGAEILAGGELIDNGPLLTRMSTFSLPAVKSADETQRTLPVPASIRGLALLSQLAVYKDLIPGYRIRQLTATEEAEKVRDEVRRQREGEKLLVKSYKGFLKILEGEIRQKSPLSSLSLRCMCELLSGVPHFNFSENIMGVLVGRVGRRSWDEDAEMVLQTFIDVFKGDITSMHSQTLVRLIARMIKERKFQVHPNVLSALLHLRLRSELDAMRDGKNKKGGGKDSNKGDPKLKGKFKSEIRKKWQTKNQKKREKEMKEVKKEMAEAAAEVDTEERAGVQTETLKNLFVLYFSILKNPQRSPLLPAALEGITHFAHHINVDFFRDLLAVLRRIILDQYEVNDDEEEVQSKLDVVGDSESVRLRLLAIVTAFDLLSGQGEALNIDLSDFITQLFGLLRPLSLDTGIEDPPLLTTSTSAPGKSRHRPAVHTETTASLLFRCLNHIFFSRHFVSPPYRAAAFAKRLLEASCLLPPATAAKTVTFVRQLVGRYQKLEGMLDSEERMADGVYKAEMDDPQLVNPFATSFFEVQPLIRHWDITVRSEGKKLGDGSTV